MDLWHDARPEPAIRARSRDSDADSGTEILQRIPRKLG